LERNIVAHSSANRGSFMQRLSSCVCNLNGMMHLKVNGYKRIFTKVHNAVGDAI